MTHGKHQIDNLGNYRPLPFIEAYTARYKEYLIEGDNGYYRKETIDFRYADGTSDSYVKRGFDEEIAQVLPRNFDTEQSYRIFTTNNRIQFKPKDIVYIGDRQMKITKVLPLLNTWDNLRMYNLGGKLYRDLAVKLIYLE